MMCTTTSTLGLAVLLLCSQSLLSLHDLEVDSEQQLQHEDQEQHEMEEFQLVFALQSRISGRYVMVQENGFVVAQGMPKRGKLQSNSQWYLHVRNDAYTLENVQKRDQYLAVAQREGVTILLAYNLSEPFTLEKMIDLERELYGEQIDCSKILGSKFGIFTEWHINSVDPITSNMVLVKDGINCYLSFNRAGYPNRNLCSLPRMGINLDIIFEAIF